MSEYRRRPCCGTTYQQDHPHDCPERGDAALSALPCDMTTDGWCAAHSTGSHVARCTPGRPDFPWNTDPRQAR